MAYDPTAYGKIIGDLQSLKTRLAQSTDFETQNLAPIVDSQISLWNTIKTRQAANKSLPDAYLKTQEDIFNYNMGLLTNYELVLKAGGSAGSAGSSVSKTQAAAPNAGG